MLIFLFQALGLNCMFLSCPVRVSEWTYTLYLPECQGTEWLWVWVPLQSLKLRPQSCLYFQGFWGSKLFNGCLAAWPNNLSARNAIIFKTQNWYLWSVVLNFSQWCFWDSWIVVCCQFDSYFMFITNEKLHFSLICSCYYCLVKKDWALKVA